MTTDTSIDDPFLPLAFSLFSNPGAYAVLAGAGVSRGAGLPTAWDIVVDLIRQIARDANDGGDIDADSAAGWYEAKYGLTPTYSDVVEQLALTPTERKSLLRKYFAPTEREENEATGPSTAHRAIARLMKAGVIRVVLTMNFDRLFEQALHELNIEPTVVATESDAHGLAPLHTVQHCIVHLHGDYLNANSMRNTTAELSGYGRYISALLRRVLSDYGLLVAGWSVQHDHALREAVAAHHRSIFTMGWVSPGPLIEAASDLAVGKKALILSTTADDAFGHLADQVESMRERRARHPLSLNVAVNRVKRELAREGPAIAAHDMITAEFSRLHSLPAFNLERYMVDPGDQSLLEQAVEASRVPAGCVAALAYWGGDANYRWWMPEIERFSRPFVRASGYTALLNLPLVTGSILFYAAGIAAAAAERFALLAKLFNLKGNRVGLRPTRIAEVLAPQGLVEGRPIVSHYQVIAAVIGEALGLGAHPADDAFQLFELLRLCTILIDIEGFPRAVIDFKDSDSEYQEVASRDTPERQKAWTNRHNVVKQVSDWCRGAPHGTHLYASERTFDPSDGHYKWGNPVAERLADEVARLGDRHPLVTGWELEPAALRLAIKGVSAAIGRCGDELQMRATPVGRAGFVPDEFWLDTGRPPGQD
jgi:hypothetical protein